MKDPAQVVCEIARLLTPGGLMWIFVDLSNHVDHMHPHAMNEDKVRKLLEGFDVVRDETPSDDDSLTELRMVRVVDLGFRLVFAGSMPCDRVVTAPPSSFRFSCKSVPALFAH